MNLESQSISLDLAMRLKELGLEKESLFYWIVLDKSHSLYIVHSKIHSIDRLREIEEGCLIYGKKSFAIGMDEFIYYPAYTVSELLEILPAWVDFKADEPFNFGWLKIQKRSAKNIQYIVHYECDTQSLEDACNSVFMKIFTKNYDEQLSNALEKILIYLIQNNYVKVEDL